MKILLIIYLLIGLFYSLLTVIDAMPIIKKEEGKYKVITIIGIFIAFIAGIIIGPIVLTVLLITYLLIDKIINRGV